MRKAKYDSTKRFVRIIAKNDAILKEMYLTGQFSSDINTLMTLEFDFSIARKFSDKSRPEVTIFDCGDYYFERENQSKNIKIQKHE